MSYHPLFLSCACGTPPKRIDEVGLTDERELLIHWRCEPCDRVVYATMPLVQCVRACPAPDVSASDADFLQRIGIKMPEDCGR